MQGQQVIWKAKGVELYIVRALFGYLIRNLVERLCPIVNFRAHIKQTRRCTLNGTWFYTVRGEFAGPYHYKNRSKKNQGLMDFCKNKGLRR